MSQRRGTQAIAATVVLLLLATGVGAFGFHSFSRGHGAAPVSPTALVAPLASTMTAVLSVSPSQVQQGQSMNLQTTVTGGRAPYSYTYSGLPPGCTGQNSPSLSCNPSSSGTYTLQVGVSDSSTNQTQSNSVTVTVTTASNGNGNGNGKGGNNSSSGLSSLFSGFSGILSLLLIFSIVGLVTWILLIVGVWVIAITLLRRLPKRGATEAAGAPMKCAACSAANPAGSKFCSACGTSTAPKSP
jgi:hypothetical protein